ncbi:hypothetical protein VTN02DRAFT_6521 [Thermoascus thermophilus]
MSPPQNRTAEHQTTDEGAYKQPAKEERHDNRTPPCGRLLPPFHKPIPSIVDRGRRPLQTARRVSISSIPEPATKRLKLGERPEEYGAGSRSLRITIRAERSVH